MRSLFCVLISFILTAPAAMADQTDPRLDLLFEELRTGDALDAETNVVRIREIWSDAQSDTVDLLFARANESATQGAFDLSEALLDHVVGLAPNFAQGYALRGIVHLNQEDRKRAVDDFTKVLQLEPRHFEVQLTLAGILYSAGDLRDAYEMYQKVLEWNPHDETARQRSRELRRTLDGQEI